jgi:hypothetical protein
MSVAKPSPRRINQEAFAEACLSFSAEGAIKWIGENLKPEQVFGGNRLDKWALENGFVKERK